MKNGPAKQELKPIKSDLKSPEDRRLAKFVSEHPELAGKAIAKWIKEDREKP